MNNRPKCIIASACLLLSAGLWGFATVRLNESRSSYASSLSQRDALRELIRTTRAAVIDWKHESGTSDPDDASREKAEAPAPSPSESKRGDAATKRIADLLAERNTALRTDPGFQAAWIDARRASMRLDYHALYRSLGLSREAIAKVEGILLQRESARVDLQAAAAELGLASDDPSIARYAKLTDAEFDAKLSGVLGEAGQAALEQYDNTKAVRNIVADIGTDLIFGNHSLSPEQQEVILQEISRRLPQGDVTISTLANIDWGEVQAALSPKLAEEQMRSLGSAVARLQWQFEQSQMLQSQTRPAGENNE